MISLQSRLKKKSFHMSTESWWCWRLSPDFLMIASFWLFLSSSSLSASLPGSNPIRKNYDLDDRLMLLKRIISSKHIFLISTDSQHSKTILSNQFLPFLDISAGHNFVKGHCSKNFRLFITPKKNHMTPSLVQPQAIFHH